MFAKKRASLTGTLDLRKPRRWPLIAGLVLGVVLVCSTGWWYGVGLPNQRAAAAREAEQSATEAAAKKKAEESATFWAKVNKENQEIAAKQKADREASNASQEEAAAGSIRKQMEDQGWTQFSGDFYYQYADKSEYTCSYSRCKVVHVTTMAPAGCPDGLYVEATVDAGGASVGRANSITAALPQGKDAIVKLTDTSGLGETISLTDLHCLGQ